MIPEPPHLPPRGSLSAYRTTEDQRSDEEVDPEPPLRSVVEAYARIFESTTRLAVVRDRWRAYVNERTSREAAEDSEGATNKGNASVRSNATE